MSISIGAAGILGVALETTSGTYVPPTKWIPFTSESLAYNTNPVEIRTIRDTAGLIDVLPGNATVEGDIEFPVTTDSLVYFLAATRCVATKSGTAPALKYLFTPTSNAVPVKTMSITIRRGDRVFCYPGCAIGGLSLAIDTDGSLACTATVTGTNEDALAGDSPLAPEWPTSLAFHAGQYVLSFGEGDATATQVFDTDTFTFAIDDAPASNGRIKDTNGSQFVNFGESSATVSVERDFLNDTDYENYKTSTRYNISLTCTGVEGDILTIKCPVAIASSYAVNIGGQGDLVRASIEYSCVIDETGAMYTIEATTPEELTI